MTATNLSPNSAQWATDLNNFRAARAAIDNHDHRANPDATDALHEVAEEAEDRVLGQWAPNIDAVADKLMILWGEDVWSGLEEGEQMRMIVGDIRRFARLYGSASDTP